MNSSALLGASSEGPAHEPVVVSKGPAGRLPLERKGLVASLRSPSVDLSFSAMDDAGMWTWAGILTAVGLVASLGIALLWQRWKEKLNVQP